MNPADDPLPPTLAARPHDVRRGIPVPFVSEHERGGEIVRDYIGVNADRARRCAEERLCGLCGTPLRYWIAFLGGPLSAVARTYGDPPMHEACAEAALRLCPHIAIEHHQRAPEHRLSPDTVTPAGWVDRKPDRWVMGITRDFRFRVRGGSLLFFASPFKRLRTFGYSEGALVEVAK